VREATASAGRKRSRRHSRRSPAPSKNATAGVATEARADVAKKARPASARPQDPRGHQIAGGSKRPLSGGRVLRKNQRKGRKTRSE
jgi:hypothetical protein